MPEVNAAVVDAVELVETGVVEVEDALVEEEVMDPEVVVLGALCMVETNVATYVWFPAWNELVVNGVAMLEVEEDDVLLPTPAGDWLTAKATTIITTTARAATAVYKAGLFISPTP